MEGRVEERELQVDILGQINLDQFPLEIWILIGVSVFYGALLVICFLRRCCLARAASEEFKIHRYTEIFNMWLWMFVYSMAYASVIIGIIQFAMLGLFFSCIALGVCIIVCTVYASTVDVIGTVGRQSGFNRPSICVMIQTLLLLYPANCVWKMSGHLESRTDADPENQRFYCCCQGGIIDPKVKDAKDIVCIQGVLQSIPAAVICLVTYVLQPIGNWDIPFVITICAGLISGLLAALLVDWDAAHTEYGYKFGRGLLLYMAGSFFKRLVELFGWVMFWTFFLMIQKELFAILFAVSYGAMLITQLDIHETSHYSRLAHPMNKIYLAFAGLFFGSYKRISVDKNFVGSASTMLPPMFDLFRYIIKFVIYVASFFASYFSDASPDLDLSENVFMTLLVWGGLACMALLLVIVIIEFLCVKRKKLKCKDCGIWITWFNMTFCWFICAPDVRVVNTDADNFQGMTTAEDIAGS